MPLPRIDLSLAVAASILQRPILMFPWMDETDARAIVRLLADVAALRADLVDARRFLIDGLVKIIDADGWASVLTYHDESRTFVHQHVAGEEWIGQGICRHLTSVGDPLSKAGPDRLSGIGRSSRVRGMAPLQRIDAESMELRAELPPPAWFVAEGEPLIVSSRQTDEGSLSSIAISRRADRPRFDERECRIAHVVLTEVRWLHLIGWPAGRQAIPPKLSPSKGRVLHLLLEGYSRKKIADKLGLSAHTVSDYAKQIYAVHGVRSHADLMRCSNRGSGGPLPIDTSGLAGGRSLGSRSSTGIPADVSACLLPLASHRLPECPP